MEPTNRGRQPACGVLQAVSLTGLAAFIALRCCSSRAQVPQLVGKFPINGPGPHATRFGRIATKSGQVYAFRTDDSVGSSSRRCLLFFTYPQRSCQSSLKYKGICVPGSAIRMIGQQLARLSPGAQNGLPFRVTSCLNGASIGRPGRDNPLIAELGRSHIL
jgi:hypothetical protein